MAVSRIFRSWLPILAEYLQYLIVWPEKEALFFIELPLNLNARTQTWSDYKNHNTITLHEKCPYSEIFWSVFSRVRTEYREIPCISPYSVQMRENTDRNNPEYGHSSRSVKYLISITPAGAISFIAKG